MSEKEILIFLSLKIRSERGPQVHKNLKSRLCYTTEQRRLRKIFKSWKAFDNDFSNRIGCGIKESKLTGNDVQKGAVYFMTFTQLSRRYWGKSTQTHLYELTSVLTNSLPKSTNSKLKRRQQPQERLQNCHISNFLPSTLLKYVNFFRRP